MTAAEQDATPLGTDSAAAPAAKVEIRRIKTDRPWIWLTKGWGDIMRAPGISLTYGLVFVLVSLGLTAGLWSLGLTSLTPALAGGFLLVGPLLAVGLYETSRRLAAGEPVSLASAAFVKTASPAQIAFMGALLLIAFLAWVRIATLLFALFVHGDYVPLSQFASFVLTTESGLWLLSVGTLIGAAIAFAVFSMTAISIPMLMDRDMDAFTAIFKSFEAVRENTAAMLLWAWLIALLIAAGIATFFLALVIVFPLVGHATWHAYRDLTGQAD